jgi:alkylation response protein AidB-like acyl-CoA dehydrogenase
VSVERHLPSDEAHALLGLVREVAVAELAPRAAAAEAAATFPRDLLTTLGELGLLGLGVPEEYGGGGQPVEVTVQVLEELAAAWATVALSVSVHTLSCVPLLRFGTEQQRRDWLPPMAAGALLGGYALSEPQAGSDAAALATTARRVGDEYRVDGTKAWITHGGVADRYVLMARTGGAGAAGISCFWVDGDTPGLAAGPTEHKMGFTASPTAPLQLADVRVGAERLIGAEGQGFAIALTALDAGRLGIAAVAVGLSQSALDTAVAYAREREQFGRPIVEFQGVSFLLADMATRIAAARALLHEAARRADRGQPVSAAAAMAKLCATDTAMAVTTDAVQVLGGNGYTTDYPAERYLREAKVLQIVEGTNQVQRLVIGRHLARGTA